MLNAGVIKRGDLAMYVRQREYKLTSEPEVREYGGFSRILFCCVAKDSFGDFDPTNQILCSHRFNPCSGQTALTALTKGNQVLVSGVFETPCNEGGGEIAHRPCADSLIMSPGQLPHPKPSECVPEP